MRFASMKSLKQLSLCLAGTLLILALSACQERPRPSPDQTMMGDEDYRSGYAGDATVRPDAGDRLDPDEGPGTQFLDDFVLDPSPVLEERQPFGEGEQVRDMFESVYFEFDRSNIRSGERAKIEEVADHLRDNPDHDILLEGHCDWRGTTEYNLGLGDRRATSVREYLQDLGISRGRIEVLSMGDLEATAGGSEEEMARDRRVEFVILQ